MAWSWALLTVGLTGLLCWLVRLSARHSGPRVWPAWEMVLAAQARDRRRYEDHEAELADELAGLQATLGLARREHEQGDTHQATRAMEVASRYVTRHVPKLRERLEIWRDAGRVLSAHYRVRRLRVRAFRLWRLRGAAAGEGLARPLLDAAHRFSLRIYVLSFGLKVVVVDFRRTAEEDMSADIESRLRYLEALGSDLGLLHGAVLEVYKALLISLHARERERQSGD